MVADPQTFHLPDLGEGLTEADIVTWRVSVGDVVRADDVLVEVETAKATVELPSPFAGTVTELHAEAGTTVPVGRALITISQPSGSADDDASGAVLVGYGTNHRASTSAPPASPPRPARRSAPRVISPLVRRLAQNNAVDLTSLNGTGPAGVILRKDIETAIRSIRPAEQPDTHRERLTGIRRATAIKLAHSRQEIPEVTTWVDADATRLLEARDAINATHPTQRIGTLALLARITVAGLGRFAALNSSIEADDGDLILVRHDAVHLGVAAQTDRGLVVPVVRDADQMTTTQLAAELTRLTERGRDGWLTPQELTGGTFTLNNYGVFGVDGSTPIINHPEAGLLGIGRIVDKAWAVNGTLEVRKVVQLSLTFDHRVCDGGVAGGFLRHVADLVERPVLLFADV